MSLRLVWLFFLLLVPAFLFGAGNPNRPIRFAVIGDFGSAGQPEADVAALVKSWNPEFIITTGDNNYLNGEASTIDRNIGQYYHEFISPYPGTYGDGATVNRFFPSLGNHDWVTPGAAPYLDYFTLPGNERYYDFVRGPVHFFAIDSDPHEPDGRSDTSVQARWLREKLASSRSKWNIVYFHHPPYSSGSHHGSATIMRWPFKAWGADMVLAGHEHLYERLQVDGIPYIINGLGGRRELYGFRNPPLPQSQVRFNGDYGAMLVKVHPHKMELFFMTRAGVVADSFMIRTAPPIEKKPRGPQLRANYPNPFNPITHLSYALDAAGHVTLRIFDTAGREIATLVDADQPAGEFSIPFDGSALASGIYFSQLATSNVVQTRKMILLK